MPHAMLAAAIAAVWPVHSVFGQTITWTGNDATSSWSDPINWNPQVVPGSGADAVFLSTDGLSRAINYDYIGPDLALNGLVIDLTGGDGSGANTLSMAANNLSTQSSESIGLNGIGFFNQSGGTNTASYDFTLGRNTGATGTYILAGTGTLSADFENIGAAGFGNFNQTGGTNSMGYLYSGFQTGATGIYNLSGGFLTGINEEDIGYGNGTDNFNQSGGTNVTASLNSGNYILSGGLLSATTINQSEEGTFNWIGGSLSTTTINVSDGTFNFAGQSLSVTKVNLTGGSVNWSGGFNSATTFNQSGGTSADAGQLGIGAGGNIGTYYLYVGTLAVGALSVAGNAFNWIGGTLNVTDGDFLVGNGGPLGSNVSLTNNRILELSNPSNTLDITGSLGLTQGSIIVPNINNSGTINWVRGTIDLTSSDVIIGNGGILGSSLTLISGQVLQVTNPANALDITGALNLAGGEIDVSAINNSGSINWTSGTVNLTNSDVTIGNGGPLGSTVTVSSGRTLEVSNPNNAVNITPTGTLNLVGGVVDAPVLNNSGTINWTSGTLNLTNSNFVVGSSGPLGSTLTLNSGQTLEVSNPVNALTITGMLTLNGGRIIAPVINNSGVFNWTSGVLTLTNSGLTVGDGGLFGSTLSLASSQTLDLTDSNSAFVVTGTLNLSGGSINTPAIISSGTINWSSGTLTVTDSDFTVGNGGPLGADLTLNNGQTLYVNNGVEVTGTLNLNGGTITAGQFNTSGTFDWTSGALNLYSGPLIIDSSPGQDSLNSGGVLTLQNGQTIAGNLTEYIGDSQNGSVSQTGGKNTASTIFVGNNNGSSGVYALAGGSNVVTNLLLGNSIGATGTYMLSGTGSMSAGTESVGNSGVGVFNQSGGMNNAGALTLASSAGSTGSYILTGTGALSSGSEFVGLGGTGSLIQIGGTNTITNRDGYLMFVIGYNSGANGMYLLGGSGSLSCGTSEYVGDNGAGIFNQSGGMNAITNSQYINALYVGDGTGSTGTYLLSGTGVLSASFEDVGINGQGIFNQSGGINTIGSFLTLGGKNSTYLLSGGALSTSQFSIGAGDTFSDIGGTLSATTINQSGGNFIDTGQLNIGKGVNVGKYNFTGGTLSVGALSETGNSFNWSGGELNITNASVTIGIGGSLGPAVTLTGAQSLNVTNPSDALDITGTLNLNGGTINTAAINNSGKFNWTSGTLVVSDSSLTIGSGGPLGSTLALIKGQALAVTNPSQSLNVSGSLSVNGATVNAATINDLGTLNFTGGAINAAMFNNSGTFNWTSGTFNLTNTSLTVGSGGMLGSMLTLRSGQALGMTNPNDSLNVTGTLNLSGGTVNAPAINDFGAINLAGGAINVATFNVPGSFNWSNGALNITTGGLTVGGGGLLGSNVTLNSGQTLSVSGPNGSLTITGTLNLNGGTINASIFNNSGTFNWTTGNFNFLNNLTIGQGGPLGSLVTLNNGQSLGVTNQGGVLSVNGVLNLVGTSSVLSVSEDEAVGNLSNGCIFQSSGTNYPDDLYVGAQAGATGTYTLSGNGAIGAANVEVGSSGTGIFNQSGGTNYSDFFSVGDGAGSIGTYTLSGTGTLTVTAFTEYGFAEFIGRNGLGNFIQNGGLNNAGAIYLGDNSGSTGTYTLSGGIVITSNAYVGGGTGPFSSPAPGGTGVLTIRGVGIFNCAGTLTVYNAPGTAVNVCGGMLNAGSLQLLGSYNQSGGMATFSQITDSGTMTITGGITTLTAGAGASQIGGLVMGSQGKLDLTNNSLTINFGSPANDPAAAITHDLASGYNGGTWTGTAGIISTSITSGSPTLSLGYADGNSDFGTAAGPNQIMVKYTLAGDANLDGFVNFADLVAVIQNFNKAGTDWAHGNFGYGVATNFFDLVAVVQNFNKLLPPPSDSAIQLGNTTFPLVAPTDVQLPEPCIAATAIALGLLARRRRRAVQ